MPKITIPPIIKALDLAEFGPGYAGVIQVRVNPTRDELQALGRLTREAFEARQALGRLPEQPEAQHGVETLAQARQLHEAVEGVLAWYAHNWSQGPDPESHWTVDELRTLVADAPEAWRWLTDRTGEMIRAQRDGQKKG